MGGIGRAKAFYIEETVWVMTQGKEICTRIVPENGTYSVWKEWKIMLESSWWPDHGKL